MSRKAITRLVAARAVGLALTACTGNTPEAQTGGGDKGGVKVANDEPGKKVVIGFSAPAADHGWMAAITNAAKAEAGKYSDVELRVVEGTNDVNLQISQVETFINDK